MQFKKTQTSNVTNAKPLRVASFIRPMIGKLRPALVIADDGSLHILKTWGNTRHPNALANEHLASALCAAVGLPIPLSRPIELTKEVLNGTSSSMFFEGCTHRPEPGMHYASPMVLPCDDTFVLDYLPRNFVQFVTNRRDFLGIYMLDVCFKHRESRKALFVKFKAGPASRGVFIDHDQMFGGSNWEIEHTSITPRHPAAGLYHGLLNEKDVTSWQRRFNERLPSAVDSAFKNLPSEWYTGSLPELHEWLHHRVRLLPQLIEQALTRDSVFRKDVNAAMHIPSPRVFQIGP